MGHPRITGVRGRGLLLAVTLTEPVAASAMTLAREAGFLVNAVQPNAIRLAPPLILTSGKSKLTVFAPTNAAFAKLPKATLKKVQGDKKLLTSAQADTFVAALPAILDHAVPA